MSVVMKRGIAIALVLAGCTATDDGPAEPPPDELPPGVWQPMPGAVRFGVAFHRSAR